MHKPDLQGNRSVLKRCFRPALMEMPDRPPFARIFFKLFLLFLKDSVFKSVFLVLAALLFVGAKAATNIKFIMPYRNIFISEADVQAVKSAIATLKDKLPFLANLTAAERQALFKTGATSLFFAQLTQPAEREMPDHITQRFAISESAPEVDLVTVLTDLVTAVEHLVAEMETQPPAVGGEAMKEKTQVYTYVKTAALNTTVVKLCFSVEVYNYIETATGNT